MSIISTIKGKHVTLPKTLGTYYVICIKHKQTNNKL